MWTHLSFGKHQHRTLPTVLFTDPDWFFWAYEQNLFSYGPIADEAELLYTRARRIHLPEDNGPAVAMYTVEPGTGRFGGLHVERSRFASDGGTVVFFRNHIDLLFPRLLRAYDKMGMRILIHDLKEILLGSPRIRMTAERCNAFFSEDRNFCLAGECAACQREKAATPHSTE